MKIYAVAIYVFSILVVEKTAFAKSFIFNKFGSTGQSLDDKKSEELEYDGTRRDLDKSNTASFLKSYKRSPDEELNLIPSYKHSAIQRKRSPYGLVYNQGKPIGILEPISQSFEYSNYNNARENPYHSSVYKSQWVPVKRDTEVVDEERDETDLQSSGLHSSNYANVLAKFKVNNKVKHRPYQDFLYSQQVKRDATSHEKVKRNKFDESKKRGVSTFDLGDLTLSQPKDAAIAKRGESTTSYVADGNSKQNLDNIIEIEENLKDVMSDMGLVQKDKEDVNSDGASLNKREIYFEDEDLENGLNKIGLTKESHYDRNKKENCPSKTKGSKSSKFSAKRQKVVKSVHKKLKKKPEDEPEEGERDSKRSPSVAHKQGEKKAILYSGNVKTHIANYQNEGEAFIRSKRQDMEKTEDLDIMKDLEQSGDLTVSGNKSPLLAVTSADDLDLKKSQEKRDKEELEYEKRLERNIQLKINAIKNEVKREISKLKNDDEKLKNMQRKKREIANTLLDGETSALDPSLNIDQKLEPYVRKRRDLDKDVDADKDKRDIQSEKLSMDKSNDEDVESNKNFPGIQSDSLSFDRVGRSIINDVSLSTKNTVANPQKESRDAINEISQVKSTSADVGKDLAKRSDTIKDSKLKSLDKVSSNDQGKDVIKRSNTFEYTQTETNRKENLDKNISKREKLMSNKATGELDINAEEDVMKRSDLRNKENALKKSKRSDNEVDFSTGKTIINLDDVKEAVMKEADGGSAVNEEGSVQTLTGGRDDQSSLQESNSENEAEKESSAKDKSKRMVKKEETELANTSLIKRQILNPKQNKPIYEIDDKENVNNVDRSKRSGICYTATDTDGLNSNSINEVEDESLAQRSAADQKFDNLEEDCNTQNKNLGNKYIENPLYTNMDGDRNMRKIYDVSFLQNNANQNLGRLKRYSQNNMRMDDDNSNAYRQNRRRRETFDKEPSRRKRNDLSENDQEYINYRAEGDGEIDGEGDEMDDDGFNDQTSNFVNKRQVVDYDQENDNNYEDDIAEDYPSYADRSKRRAYEENEETGRASDNFLFPSNQHARQKRQNFEELVASHGGEKALKHLAAVRERNMRPIEKNYRRKRLEKLNRLHSQKQNIAELSDADVFGGLPQSYEGELSRFKRVKRFTNSQT